MRVYEKLKKLLQDVDIYILTTKIQMHDQIKIKNINIYYTLETDRDLTL